MVVGIIGVGAIYVFSGDMTVGALVAFNMLAGRVRAAGADGHHGPRIPGSGLSGANAR